MQEYLIYVIKIGFDHKDRGIYEFIFTDNLDEDVEHESWGESPSMGNNQSPDEDYISSVGSFKTNNFDLEVVQDSQFFGMCDAVDDIIALAWEINQELVAEEGEEEKRVVFRYGQTKDVVEKTLLRKGIKMKYD